MTHRTPRPAAALGTLALLAAGAALPAALRAQTSTDGSHARPRPGATASAHAGPRRLEAGRTPGITLDGRLDEPAWRAAPAATDFIQSEPFEGRPASERTEVRVLSDGKTLYIGARLLDRDPTGIVVRDLDRDFDSFSQDVFEVLLDTFHDGRNGYVFIVNPEGARADYQVTGEGRDINVSWDAPWRVATRRTSEGWTAEMAIPFRVLRFDPQRSETWGINFGRRIRRRNEVDYWSPISRSYGFYRVSRAGELVGLAAPRPGRDLRVTPYVLGKTVRETGAPAFAQDAAVGADAKVGLTNSLTLDVTAHPDFAQVEADVQEVNFTQFSQLFPEKRGFFLENSGIFYVGDRARRTGVGLSTQKDEDLIPFFSRRIGLTADGRPVPILGGTRLTGHEGGFGVGALWMRTEDAPGQPAADYAVARVRRNLFSNSDVGGIVMMRRSVHDGSDRNLVYGTDADVRLPGDVDWSAFLLGTNTPGVSGGQYAYRTSLMHEGDFVHWKVGVMTLGENFRDDLGYYRRTGARKWILDSGLRPRFDAAEKIGIREIHPHTSWNYYTDLSGRIVGKLLHTGITAFLSNGGNSQLAVNPTFERIDEPLVVDKDVPALPAGAYGWTDWKLDFTWNPSSPVSFMAAYTWGGLWTGTQHTWKGELTLQPGYHLRTTIGMQRTQARLTYPASDTAAPADARFVKALWTARAAYSFSTKLHLDALLQYDTEEDLVNVNVRLDLLHAPMSDLYIVYNEQRFVTPGQDPLPGRSVILKLTRMLSL
jgi:hypothetical protein